MTEAISGTEKSYRWGGKTIFRLIYEIVMPAGRQLFRMCTPTRILAVDDHVLFRESLVRLLECEPDFHVVAQCGSITEALVLLSRNAVDLVLLDYELGEGSGLDLLREFRGRGERVQMLVVTGGISDANTVDALRAGAAGVLFKHSDPSRLLEAVRRISKGEMWLDSGAVRSLIANAREQAGEARRKNPLSLRQQQVLSGVLHGLSNKEIAWKLKLSATTVKVAIQSLFEKAGVRTRTQLVRVALEKQGAGWRVGDEVQDLGGELS